MSQQVGDLRSRLESGRPNSVSIDHQSLKVLAGGEWRRFPLYGSEMTLIAIDPADPATIYVGSRGAGVFRTTDGGLTW